MALLILTKNLEINLRVRPIPLSKEEPKQGATAIASGWGQTHNSSSSLIPNFVELPILPRETCNNCYPGLITPRMICAGYMSGEHDTCNVLETMVNIL